MADQQRQSSAASSSSPAPAGSSSVDPSSYSFLGGVTLHPPGTVAIRYSSVQPSVVPGPVDDASPSSPPTPSAPEEASIACLDSEAIPGADFGRHLQLPPLGELARASLQRWGVSGDRFGGGVVSSAPPLASDHVSHSPPRHSYYPLAADPDPSCSAPHPFYTPGISNDQAPGAEASEAAWLPDGSTGAAVGGASRARGGRGRGRRSGTGRTSRRGRGSGNGSRGGRGRGRALGTGRPVVRGRGEPPRVGGPARRGRGPSREQLNLGPTDLHPWEMDPGFSASLVRTRTEESEEQRLRRASTRSSTGQPRGESRARNLHLHERVSYTPTGQAHALFCLFTPEVFRRLPGCAEQPGPRPPQQAPAGDDPGSEDHVGGALATTVVATAVSTWLGIPHKTLLGWIYKPEQIVKWLTTVSVLRGEDIRVSFSKNMLEQLHLPEDTSVFDATTVCYTTFCYDSAFLPSYLPSIPLSLDF
eukprot:GHVU01010238.1.p1 GENE.GHVU01010238.1~~GHVU01010238.1.p1  ORF type:complete len:474 (+),score=20.44 GHVU01010238.1:130-1551(+)